MNSPQTNPLKIAIYIAGLCTFFKKKFLIFTLFYFTIVYWFCHTSAQTEVDFDFRAGHLLTILFVKSALKRRRASEVRV